MNIGIMYKCIHTCNVLYIIKVYTLLYKKRKSVHVSYKSNQGSLVKEYTEYTDLMKMGICT